MQRGGWWPIYGLGVGIPTGVGDGGSKTGLDSDLGTMRWHAKNGIEINSGTGSQVLEMGVRNWSCRIQKLAGSEAYESPVKFVRISYGISQGPAKFPWVLENLLL